VPLLLAEDLARDDVARRQLGERVARRHEPLAARVDERRPLAAHRLADERERVLGRVERGGVELHELHVGEPRAGAPGDRVAVAGGHLRVRGVAVHLAAAAGGEHRGVGGDLDGAAGRRSPARRRSSAAPLAVDHEVEHARLLEHAHARARAHALDERARHLGARLVAARVDDAARRVRGLAPELEVAPSSVRSNAAPAA
jgi:hypothetical protein